MYEFIIGKIVIWLGIIVLILILLTVIGIFAYTTYDQWVKKILRWNDKKTRNDIWYFIEHREEIEEYIKNK